MALEDFASSEVGIAVAATALALSPDVRRTVRRGAVFGLAALMKVGDAVATTARGAGDAVATTARGAASEIQQTASAGATAAQDTVTEARATARRSRNSRSKNE